MSLSAATILLMAEKGLTAHDIADIAASIEGVFFEREEVLEPASSASKLKTVRMNSSDKRKAFNALVDRDGYTCRECSCMPKTIWRRQGVNGSLEEGNYHTYVVPTTNLEVDHYVPLWDGGTNDISNLQLLCVDCHRQKTGEEARLRGIQ